MESFITELINTLVMLVNIVLHLDVHLAEWSQSLGPWMYVLLFLVIFAETGLVVAPFLPGDSLLFAAGAIATVETAGLNVHWMAVNLLVAGILGDFVNYSIGKALGPKIFRRKDSLLLNKEHLVRTQDFYVRHGAKTIIIARFAPIIRTFAPFVAGIGKMRYSRFVIFNAVGALLWVYSFLYAGYFFGNLPSVKRNFHLIIFAVIGLSLMPVLIGWLQNRKFKNAKVLR
jgi:membrane-associated protein